MQIFVVSPWGKTLNLDVTNEDSFASISFKALSKVKLGKEKDYYYLAFGGRGLRDDNRVSDYGIQEGSTLQLQFRLPGSANLGKKIKGSAEQRPAAAADGLTTLYNRMREADSIRQRALLKQEELRSLMEQEQKNSKTNQLKIQNQWRKIMRLAKVESLKKDIEILSQNHERDVDRKDAIIQMLDRDLEEAEDQFQMALRAHLRNMDKLIDLQDSRLLALEQEFETELKTLEHDFNTEREMIIKQHRREVQELQDIMAEVDQLEAEQEAEFRTEHDQNREENKNKNIEDINMLRLTLDSHIEELELSFEQAHLQYLQNTDQRTQEFKYLREKDTEQSKLIEQKIRKIENLQTKIQHWRTKITQNVKENAERNKLLMEERNTIQGHFQALKGRMNKFREVQARRLAGLTQNAHECTNHLSGQIEMAERILKLAELARKAETEHEKVLPFFLTVQSEQLDKEADAMILTSQGHFEKSTEDEKTDSVLFQTAAYDKTGKRVEHWNMLDNFHKKFNRVLMDKLAIEREKERLVKENADLQDILKQYLDGISVNDDVINNANSLFVINGRTNLNHNLPVRRRDDGIPIIEGNHMVGTHRVNNRVGL